MEDVEMLFLHNIVDCGDCPSGRSLFIYNGNSAERNTNMADICEKIQLASPNLTKKQMSLGRFICDNTYEASFMNAPRIAREAGVSEATLTRFVYALGYNGFSDFQADLRRKTQRANHTNPFRQESYGDTNEPVYNRVFNFEYGLMAETMELIVPEVFDHCVNLLYKADKIVLAGGPIHSFLTDYAQNFLSILCNSVEKVTAINMEYLCMLDRLTPKSVALVFSYPRYPKETQRVVEGLHNHGVKIIGITNSQLSPIIPYSDYVLITPQKYLIPTEPIAAVVTMVHALTVGVYKLDPLAAKRRLEQYEKSVVDADIFEFKDYNFAHLL